MKNKVLQFSIVLMVFLLIGFVNATEDCNVLNMENSNLIEDNIDTLSVDTKLENSNEYSISKTNIVNSHDDNFGNYSYDTVLTSSASCEDNNQLSFDVDDNCHDMNSILNDDKNVLGSKEVDYKLSNPISTQLSISDTHYEKSATSFMVTLKDTNGNALTNQQISLSVNSRTYSAITNSLGVASIKTGTLAVGTYSVSLSYAGNSDYSSSSISKKVKVLSSVTGSDLTKYYGTTTKYKATFWKGNAVLANTKVSFKVNGKTYTRTTNKNGVASVNINLNAGKHVITATNTYSGEKASNKIVVKKDSTAFSKRSSKTYILPDHKYTFAVTIKSKHGVVVKNAKVSFNYNKNTVTAKTNSKGKASIKISALPIGTYKINYKFDGNNNFYSTSNSGLLIVKNSTTKLSASNLKMNYNDGSKFKVKLTNVSGKVLTGKVVKFKLNGKSYSAKTNSKGYAKLSIKNLNPAIYKIYYSYSSSGLKNYAHGSSKIIIFKATAKLSSKNLVMNKGDGSTYNIKVKDDSGKVLKNVFVKSVINGKSYIYASNSKGIAKLKIKLGVGEYSISSIVADPCYKSKTITKNILVNGTKFIANDLYVSYGKSATFSVKLVDAKNDVIKNAKVVFTLNGKSSNVRSDASGIAKLSIGKLSKGQYSIVYAHGAYSDSSKVYVVDKVTIKQLVTASKNVKNYIGDNAKIPSTVKIGDITFSTAEYLYLTSKAIVNLKSGSKADIVVVDVDNPTNPKSASNLGNLYDYVSVAKSIVSTAESKGIMPNSVSSKVGTIGYKGVVDAFSRVMVQYGSNNKLPSYISIKSISSSSSSTSNLNSRNTVSNLAAYLAASTNCQVNNAQITELVTKLTKDCKTDKEKATAIYNYVRDTLSYSFYYNTKYGAVGTLKAKTGNCVDHSHLLVAMFRNAGLAARYVHGTCTFTSGNTYGHVWSQVLIGDTWTVADATSSRNSLGNVANWNTNSYKLDGYFASISF